VHLWKKRKISGLFLSSSVSRDSDYVMENQLEVLRILRSMGYSGYIHLRLMPGMSRHYVREAVELADRVGVNLEAPNKVIFDEICPDKGGFNEAVLTRLTWTVDEVNRVKQEAKESKVGFGKSGVDTQIIVGATDDNDWQHLQVTEWLYKKHGLKRVYYSGFEPITQTPLEKRMACPTFREYRLYQCSFLIRDYGFRTDDLAQIVDDEGFLPNVDPKLKFVKANQDFFPIDLNTATYNEIVRTPHIGPLTAKRIIEARKEANIQYSTDLEKIMGANMTRRIGRYIELKDKRLIDFPKEDTLINGKVPTNQR